MVVLKEMQFEILPSVNASNGVGFGIGLDVSIDEDGFHPGGNDWFTQDSESPTRGTTAFGRDHLLGPTWAWDMHVNREDTEGAAESLSQLASAWRAQNIRHRPGAVLPIRYRLAGRNRRIYGRPRRFDSSPNNLIMGGYIPVSADFKCVDAYTYDDASSSVILGLANLSAGGFIFPIVFPTSTEPVGDNAAQAVVGGDAPTHPVIRFTGPINHPYLATNSWRISVATNIGVGEYVEVDTRPWALTVLHSDGRSLAGKLGRREWMSDIKFMPGSHDLAFGGSSSSGGAACEVTWRNAYNGY